VRQQNGLLAVLLVIVVMAGFGALIIANAPQAPVLQALVPTEIVPTDDLNSWQNILREGFGDNSTPLPTIAIPTEPFVPPTLIPGDRDTIPLGPADFVPDVLPTFTPFNAAVTPTLPPATAQMVATQAPVTAQAVTREASVWNPPPLLPPLSRDPLGRDHYWLQRPVESNATNYGLFYYPYGSDGPNQESDWPVHHGIDMPNPVGETVRAAGSGEVIWAADGLRVQGGTFQNSPSYGTSC
jgi:murein DD-endopeptidase MepM/ murein hydrolase activator NlpD